MATRFISIGQVEMVSSTELYMSQTGDDFLLRFSLSLSHPMMTRKKRHCLHTCNRISVNSHSFQDSISSTVYRCILFPGRQRQQAGTCIYEYLSSSLVSIHLMPFSIVNKLIKDDCIPIVYISLIIHL